MKKGIKFETETARKEFYSALANELYFIIKKKYGTLKAFAEVKGIGRSHLVTVLNKLHSPYWLRLIAYLVNNEDAKAEQIKTKIPKLLITKIEKAILEHPDSKNESGTIRMSAFFRKNTQWDSGWWGTVVSGIRITPSRRIMELVDYVLDKEIFEYLTKKP